MPTGYTAKLEEMNWDLKRWLVECLSRNFGMLVMLREEPWDLTEDQIRELLVKEQKDSYHRERVDEYRAELEELKSRTEEQWIQEIQNECSANRDEYDRRKAELVPKIDAYQQSLETLREWRKKTRDEEFRNFLKFAVEQLEMVENEFVLPTPPVYPAPDTSPEEFANRRISVCSDNLEYHEREMVAGDKRCQERFNLFVAWAKYVKILP